MAMQVEVVSPEEVMYSDEAIQVVARTRGGGEIAFLTGHEPFIGSLQASQVRVTDASGAVQAFVVRGGFVSVTGTMAASTVTVLSDAAQTVDSLNRATVEGELAEATAALAADPDDSYARDDVRWAEVRLAAIDHQRAASH